MTITTPTKAGTGSKLGKSGKQLVRAGALASALAKDHAAVVGLVPLGEVLAELQQGSGSGPIHPRSVGGHGDMLITATGFT